MVQDQSDPIHEAAQWVSDIDIEAEIVRPERLGGFAFGDARPVLDDVQRACRLLLGLPTASIADIPQGRNLATRLGALRTVLQDMANFDPTAVDQPREQRANLLTRIRDVVSDVKSEIASSSGYLLLSAIDPAGVASDLAAKTESRIEEVLANERSRLDSAVVRAEAAWNDAQEVAESAKSAAEAARLAAGVTGVAVYADVFREEAINHRERAKSAFRWGIGGIFALIVTGYGIVTLIPVGAEISSPITIQQILLKALAITFGGYLVMLAFRIFRAETHLAVVADHRDRALRTFQAFAAAASPEGGVRDAVLLEATRAVFASTNTGLLDGNDQSPQPTAMLEIVRQSLTGRTGPGT